MLKAHVHEENENIAVEFECSGTRAKCRLDVALLVLAVLHRMTEDTVAHINEEYKKENPDAVITDEMITEATDVIMNDQLEMFLKTLLKALAARTHKKSTVIDVSLLSRLKAHLDHEPSSSWKGTSGEEQSVDTNEQEEENNA